ncbi:MAG: 2Fe-2S iron-sulfur cluster binding domain-containing protein [Treponema sp.]|nr:2Fe-2S iron-sulfur cluster binding domain-containing protein [Treponema sp.]
MKITLTINNISKLYDVDVETKLIDILRNENLTSPKDGCGKGECGCCTVLIDNKPVPSCLIPALSARESNIETLEYFMTTDNYKDIAEGFSKHNIILCGYCNTGKIFGTHEIINNFGKYSEEKILNYCNSFRCLCTETSSLMRGIYESVKNRNKRLGVIKNEKK